MSVKQLKSRQNFHEHKSKVSLIDAKIPGWKQGAAHFEVTEHQHTPEGDEFHGFALN